MEEEKFEDVSLFEDDKPAKEPTQAIEQDKEADDAPVFEVPEKFQGKSFEDVVDAYSNLEKEMGRKANEVGELRKLTDQILKQQVEGNVSNEPAPTPKEVGFDDIVQDPKKAVDDVLSENPRLAKLEQMVTMQATANAQRELLSKHSDANEITSSAEFAAWLQASPSRQRLYNEAHTNLDVALGAGLIDMYKQEREMTVQEAETERQARADAGLKDALGSAKGSGATPSKKRFRRADLIRLKMERPHEYDAMREEIMQAYAEKRVI